MCNHCDYTCVITNVVVVVVMGVGMGCDHKCCGGGGGKGGGTRNQSGRTIMSSDCGLLGFRNQSGKMKLTACL